MSERTKIQWADSTWNPWIGCTKVSPGCANCYAEGSMPARMLGVEWGLGKPRRVACAATWKSPMAWNRKPWVCNRCGVALSQPQLHVQPGTGCPCVYDEDAIQAASNFHRRRVFTLSLGDWLDPEVPIELFIRFLNTVRQCTELNWILCTKRLERFFERMNEAVHWPLNDAGFERWARGWSCNQVLPENVCVLASVEDQKRADDRVPALLRIPARWHGLSLEPLLGPVDFDGTRLEWIAPFKDCDASLNPTPKLDWLVIGGESGKGARSCRVEWIRSLVAQGQAAGAAVFVKQLGAQVEDFDAVGDNQFDATKCWPNWTRCTDRVIHLQHPKGGDPDEWPADLRVRQWPEGL